MQGALLPGWIGATVALLVLIAFTYAQFRHIGLALAAALAPLPGYAVAIALHMPQQPLAYLCGFVAAIVLCSEVGARICDGVMPSAASKQAVEIFFAVLIWPLALAICVAAVPALAFHDPAGLTLSLAIVLCVVSTLIVVFSILRFLPYGEEFIARANRLREQRERWLDQLTFLVQPRWGWSVCGIALIFAVLGFFGGAGSSATGLFAPFIVLPASGILFVAFAYVVTRNIRRAITFLLSAAVLACLMFWMSGHIAVAAPSSIIGVASMSMLLLAVQSSAFMRAGDSVAVATLRSFEQFAVPILFYSLATLLALCALGAFGAAILMACGGIVALVVFPALTTAIYDLFPPRVSLDAYRVR